MLVRYWHRHLAKKLFPAQREKRLLYFAGPAEDATPEENEEDAENAEPNDAQGNNEGNAEQEVAEDTEETRLDINEALHTPESVLTHTHEVRERLNTMVAELKKINHPELRKQLNEMEEWHEGLSTKLWLVETLMKKHQEWKQQRLEPDGYIDAINHFLRRIDAKERAHINAGAGITTEEWFAMPRADRLDLIAEVNEELRQQERGNVEEGADQIVDGVEEALDKADNKLSDFIGTHSPGVKTSFIGSLKAAVDNVQFVSIMDLWRSGQKYVEAVKSAWDKRADRVSAGLASNLGSIFRFIPLGNEVYAELAAARESKNDEEKKQQKDLLSQNNTIFTDAVSELKRYRNNANKFNGVLEYLADNGWLYDFDPTGKKVFGIDIPRPQGWTDTAHHEYLIRTLSVDSDTGQANQKKRTENIIGTADSIPPIAKFLEDELNNHNYWAVHSALEIAMRKGKIGESGTWITTIFLRHLRNDQDARKYIPIDIHDQLGNIGIEHPAWTPTFLKVDRKKLETWQKTNDPDRFKYSGTLSKAIVMIEEDLKSKFGTEEQMKQKLHGKIDPPITMDRLIAMVLSAQLITDDTGKTVSIFDSRYNNYRNEILKNDTSINAGKADDDFYGNISDAHLIGLGGIRVILRTSTRGIFEHPTKANSYLTNAFKIDDQLGDAGNTEAQRNYRRDMQGKFNRYFEEEIAQHGSTKDGWLLRTVTNPKDGGPALNVVQEFVKRGMLSAESFKKTFDDEGFRKTFGDQAYREQFGDKAYREAFGDQKYIKTFGKDAYIREFGQAAYNKAMQANGSGN